MSLIKEDDKMNAWFNLGPLWCFSEKYYYTTSLYRFAEAVSKGLQGLVVITPVFLEPPPENAKILDSSFIKVLALPPYESVAQSFPSFIKFLSKKNTISWHAIKQIILMDVSYPYFWWFMFKALSTSGVKPLIYLRADESAIVPGRSFSLKKYILRLVGVASFTMIWLFNRWCSIATTSEDIAKRVRGKNSVVHIVSPSVISKDDVMSDNPSAEFTGRRLIFVGRLAEEKGIEILLQAVKLLVETGYNVQLKVIGRDNQNGKYLQYLKKLAGLLVSQGYVEFVGHISHGPALFKIMKSMEVLVIPSYSEGRPKVIYEAMGNKLLIVASSVGGMKEIIQNGINGYLVSSGSVDGFFNKLKYIQDHSDEAAQVLEKSIAEFNNFTMESATHKFIEMLNAASEMERS